MTTIFARSPLQSLPMATNRPTTRRRSAKQAFEDDDAPALKRPKTEVNGTVKRTAAATKKATKAAAYDEDDDGFQFSRRTSRRTTKANTAPAPEPIPEEKPAKPVRALETQQAKTTSRQKKKSIAAIDPETSDSSKRRRSARISGDREQLEVRPKVPHPPPAKPRTKKVAPVEKEKKKQTTPAPEPQPEPKGAYAAVQTPTTGARKRDPNAQRIMLPFADTPVITRNKEMRKGNKDGPRRSSTGLRGRRASSLIDSGQSNALPHSEVEAHDFYKYIEQSLPEPRRMKQLLTWCGTRALPAKPSGDVKNANAIMAARAIQQELIDEFASRPELSDWFSREEPPAPPVVKKPNPQNEKNKATLQELEEEVKRLEEEKAAWETIASTSKPTPAPSIPPDSTPPPLSAIDASLLDPSQAAILSALQQEPQPPSSTFNFSFTSPASLQSHLDSLANSLEPHIDVFADGLHKIEQYRNTAERVADRVLATAARRLEERDREAKERVGTVGVGVGDVLRGLAGVLGEGAG
ncbi:Kinetochore protein Mis13 [Pyrenophora tritici-repentis]|nr:Kinetochore protein Mis13 [Pyrenophora tritici-repentis]KAI0581388.1 Kinetochore protein Mis13 [Pyrenophora tritici-repentis]KAI0584503.1 Kinetochore protein Mis13 [Pyrenophora tritici-repentis]KAI0610608.1 Kinetochore protein Mis13 [Pyrenophora tritici-repentis]KAI0627088.1 Kinetochore protein Mis13 [Pyrenophora tritici-repentis]